MSNSSPVSSLRVVLADSESWSTRATSLGASTTTGSTASPVWKRISSRMRRLDGSASARVSRLPRRPRATT